MAHEVRPEIRRDDIKDISKILKYFFDMYAEEIYANHLDLFGQDQDFDMLAARFMGRDMAKIARLNEELFVRIASLLDKNTVSPASSEIAKIMVEFFENTVQASMDMLIEIKVGFME
jgi:predicted nucleotidyltransferase